MKAVKEFLNDRSATWLFAICLVTFILLKIPHLSLPFFWDETGVYAKMIFELTDQHLSLHPKVIDQWISRGHPLLYPNIIAIFCKIFGENVTIAHIGNFTLSCLLLISIFRCLSKAFEPWIGFFASILLMALPIFYTQSVFVLPEIALTLFLWWTTWFFIQKKYFLYFLFGSAAVLIKEPAIIWIGALFLWDVWKNKKSPTWKLLVWLLPLIPFCIFLYFQKKTFGWYFFPYHTGGFDIKFESISDKLIDYLKFLFWRQGRFLWLCLILIGLFIFFYRRSRRTSSDKIGNGNNRYYAGVFAGIIYVIFSSTTFFGERYVMPVLPIITSIVAYVGYQYVFKKQIVLILLTAVTLNFISFQFMDSDKFNYDNDMSYVRSIASSKKTIRYLLDRNMLAPDEFTATMPLLYVLSEPRFGYLPKDTTAKYSKQLHKGSKYAIQVIPGTQIENPDQLPLSLQEEWHDGDITTRIYKVIPVDSIEVKK